MKRKEKTLQTADTKFYSLIEVCEILNVHRTTVYRHMKTGGLKATRIFGKWVVSETEVLRILNP